MAYDFPNSPTENQEYVPPIGGQTYIYKAPRWLVKGVPPAGGGGGSGIDEAPVDSKQYGRYNTTWTEVLPNPTWTTLSGKPATFPPTVPIAWTDVSGKPATYPPTLPILESDVTNLVTDLAAKQPLITAGTTGQYYRGDKTFQTLDKTAVGLANVDNTSDANKPVSTATTTALNLKEDKANKGAANGYAPLDAGTKIAATYLPAYVDDVLEYANLAAFPGTGTTGIIYVALDTNKTYRWSGSAYVEISPSPGSTDAVPEGSVNLYYTNARASAAAPVQSVASRTGAVTLTKTDVGLANVDNTSDANKPVSTAQQTAINAKLDTSAYTASDVLSKLSTVDGAGSGLDADLLDGQSSSAFAASVHTHVESDVTNLVTDLAAKAPLVSPAFTGTPTVPTATAGTNTTQAASTAFVASAIAGFTSGASVSDSAPSNPSNGQFWLDSTTMNLYIWYTDPNTSQWVQINNVGAG